MTRRPSWLAAAVIGGAIAIMAMSVPVFAQDAAAPRGAAGGRLQRSTRTTPTSTATAPSTAPTYTGNIAKIEATDACHRRLHAVQPRPGLPAQGGLLALRHQRRRLPHRPRSRTAASWTSPTAPVPSCSRSGAAAARSSSRPTRTTGARHPCQQPLHPALVVGARPEAHRAAVRHRGRRRQPQRRRPRRHRGRSRPDRHPARRLQRLLPGHEQHVRALQQREGAPGHRHGHRQAAHRGPASIRQGRRSPTTSRRASSPSPAAARRSRPSTPKPPRRSSPKASPSSASTPSPRCPSRCASSTAPTCPSRSRSPSTSRTSSRRTWASRRRSTSRSRAPSSTTPTAGQPPGLPPAGLERRLP